MPIPSELNPWGFVCFTHFTCPCLVRTGPSTQSAIITFVLNVYLINFTFEKTRVKWPKHSKLVGIWKTQDKTKVSWLLSSFYQQHSSQELDKAMEDNRGCFWIPSHSLPKLSSLRYTYPLSTNGSTDDRGPVDTSLRNSTKDGLDLTIW